MAHVVFAAENEVCAYNEMATFYFNIRTEAALLSAA